MIIFKHDHKLQRSKQCVCILRASEYACNMAGIQKMFIKEWLSIIIIFIKGISLMVTYKKNPHFGKRDLRVGSATKDECDEFTYHIFVNSDTYFQNHCSELITLCKWKLTSVYALYIILYITYINMCYNDNIMQNLTLMNKFANYYFL